MSERCPTCGVPVSVSTDDEGTSHYVPRPPLPRASEVPSTGIPREAIEAAARALTASSTTPPYEWDELPEATRALRLERGRHILERALPFLPREQASTGLREAARELVAVFDKPWHHNQLLLEELAKAVDALREALEGEKE